MAPTNAVRLLKFWQKVAAQSASLRVNPEKIVNFTLNISHAYLFPAIKSYLGPACKA
jgi:hypothetical protein